MAAIFAMKRAVVVTSVKKVDPLFEFDAPQQFVDLTQLPIYSGAHDSWFDMVHFDHSKPSNELAQEEAEAVANEKLQTTVEPNETNKTISIGGHKDGHRRNSALLEKENRLVGERRGTVSIKKRALAGNSNDRLPARFRQRTALGESTAGGNGAKDAVDPVKRRKAAINSLAAPTISSAMKQQHLPVEEHSSSKRVPVASFQRARYHKELGVAQDNNRAKARSVPSNTMSSHHQKTPASNTSKDMRIGAAATTSSKAKIKMNTIRKHPTSSSSIGSKNDDLDDLKKLLAKHNKKVKATHVTHAYEPRNHSLRDVKMWEIETNQQYYNLSAEDRIRANKEITQMIKERQSMEEMEA